MDDRHVNTVDQPMELYSSAVQVSILPFVHKCRNRLSKPSVQINRGQMRVTVWTRDTVCWVAVTILGQVCGKVQNSHNLVLLWENLPSALECQLSQEKLSRRTRASVTLPGSPSCDWWGIASSQQEGVCSWQEVKNFDLKQLLPSGLGDIDMWLWPPKVKVLEMLSMLKSSSSTCLSLAIWTRCHCKWWTVQTEKAWRCQPKVWWSATTLEMPVAWRSEDDNRIAGHVTLCYKAEW